MQELVMNIHNFTLGLGIVFVLVGILGFVPALVAAPPMNAPEMSTEYGLLFGLFPVNFLHNVVHLGTGVWALFAYKDVPNARFFNQTLAVLYGLLTIMGLIPVLNTTFGFIPLFGHDIWLHAIIAIGAAYFGFSSLARTESEHHHA
jgi:hypothetical protein